MAAPASSPAKRKSKDSSGGDKAPTSSPRSHTSHKKSKLTSSTNASANPPSKKDRQSQRKHADIVVEGKRLWNQLRCKGNTIEQTRSLLDELMPLITGKVPEIALQHDASRVVQAAIQFGNTPERQQIVRELCAADGGKGNSSNSSNAIVELCKSQYAHFVVLKIIKYCSGSDGHHSDCMKQITSKLKGHMAKLAVHATASRVVQSLWEHLATTTTHREQWATLKLDFYGPQFALFAPDTLQKLKQNASKEGNKNTAVVVPTLSAILKLYPDQKDATLDFVKRLVYKGMEKQLYGLGYFHTLLLEYLQCSSTLEIRAVAGTASDHALHLLSGRAGTHVVALLASYGTAKDRKRLCKSLKGFARSGLLHRDAYLAILRLVQVTDDCVLIQKNILQELLVVPSTSVTTTTTTLAEHSKTKEAKQQSDEKVESPLLEFALSDSASKLLLMLLIDEGTDAWNKMLDPYERQVLFANPTVMEQGQPVPTSKKEPAARRLELLPIMREPLVELCSRHADQLLRSIQGSAVRRPGRAGANCSRPASSSTSSNPPCITARR